MNCKFKIAAAGIMILGLSACSAVVDTRGNMPAPEQVARIKPGVDDRERVRRVLGSPTSTSSFDNGSWYYIARKTETIAFLTPTIVESQVVVVHFNDQGIVTGVEQRGPEAATEVEVSDRETPTAGHGEGILAQLFGNIGRFGKQPGGKTVGTNIPGR